MVWEASSSKYIYADREDIDPAFGIRLCLCGSCHHLTRPIGANMALIQRIISIPETRHETVDQRITHVLKLDNTCSEIVDLISHSHLAYPLKAS
eukprot:1362548-Amphidinium_carterae.1